MSEVTGKMIYCERPGCEEKVFLAKKSETHLDGGFTVVGQYEPMPEMWEWERGYGMLCPECHKEYKKMMEAFNNAKVTGG